jgi:hypothetical protein
MEADEKVGSWLDLHFAGQLLTSMHDQASYPHLFQEGRDAIEYDSDKFQESL